MKNNSVFIGQYPVSKTLRFELIPQGKTKELLIDFRKEKEGNLLQKEKQRADEYQKMKVILDDYYRFFIDDVLEEEIITQEDFCNAYTLYCERKHKETRKKYEKKQKEFRTRIAKKFKDKTPKYALKDYSDLINRKKGKEPIILQWLQEEHRQGRISDDHYEEALSTTESFMNFTTYFTGYKENRKNLFSNESDATAIAHRIVNVNMEKYFNNSNRYEMIKHKHPSLYESLKKYEKIFDVGGYGRYITQNGITEYNKVVGKPQDKGVNQLINEYRLKHNIKGRDLPIMEKLYKQLLSKEESTLYIEQVTSDQELFFQIKELQKELCDKNYLERIKQCIVQHVTRENAESIYIKSEGLPEVSKRLYGEWNRIQDLIEKYVENNFGKKKEKESWLKRIKTVISLAELNKVISSGEEDTVPNNDELFTGFREINHSQEIMEAFGRIEDIIAEGSIDKDRTIPSEENEKGGKGFEQISNIKKYFDTLLKLVHHIKPFVLIKNGNWLDVPDKDEDFYMEINEINERLRPIDKLYNVTRNYLTQRPYSKEKFKLCFEKNTLLDGWDLNKERDNLSVLLRKDGNYFLGIMSAKANKTFNYQNDSSLNEKLTPKDSDDFYEKVEYKLLPDPAKMLPKVFFGDRNQATFKPSDEITKIKKKGLYKKEVNDKDSLVKWIEFCQNSLDKHPEWSRFFKFYFRKPSEYEDVSEFYKDVADKGYSLNLRRIKASYIEEKVKQGELYLFQIYNKDFSKHSKGKPNLHTMYWRALFDETNLKRINNTNEPIIKLNGEAEIFLREASLEYHKTHCKNIPITNKRDDGRKRTSVFDYDIAKDKRFTEDKFFFHCPITINFRGQKQSVWTINERANSFVEKNEDVNIIGIDRGERHLLYYTMINQNGKIIKQGSLNQIENQYNSGDGLRTIVTDYQELLNHKELERMKARKAWGTIENIKELKSGYLSQVVHQIAKMMVENNAIVVLEDLNSGFKRSRIKIEKQVYQRFEKALIDKLNYLVFKDCKENENGHCLRGYQLSAPFESFEKLGKQSGLIYYVWPSYTSRICPLTGFVDLLKPRYTNINNAKKYFKKFDDARYNKEQDYFEFTFDYKNFTDKAGEKQKWEICSHGNERYYYNAKDKKYECYDVTAELKELFTKHGIEWQGGRGLVEKIIAMDNAEFFKSITFLLRLILQMRNTYKIDGKEADYILSPVRDEKTGIFFDSRKAQELGENLPYNADANGAYHIALKGSKLIKQIEEGKIGTGNISDKEWFDFAQGR